MNEDLSEQEDQERILMALEAGQIGIWTWYAHEDRLVWDKTMFEIYDLEEKDFNGKYSCFEKRVHPEDRKSVDKMVKDAVETNCVFHTRFRILDRTGSIRHIAGKGKVATDDKGNIRVLSGINFDITKLVQIEQDLENSNRELESFAYAVSHDLQEPLRTVSSFVTILKDKGGHDPQTFKYLELIGQSSNRMKRMINDLLEYSKATVAGKTLKLERFNPSVTVGEVCSLLRACIKETNARIVAEQLPDVYMNPVHLSQIFQNLINNSLKYAKDGEIPLINITCRENLKHWEFCVQDNGIGIDPRYQDKLFQLFQRIGPKAKHGSGIGLALCKRIVSIYGGRIWIRSELGQGTKVHFTIPKAMREKQYDDET